MHIERIQDVDTLRKVALLLDRHVRTLNTYVQELKEENARLKGQDAKAVQREIEALKELLAQRDRVIFAEKTEQRPQTGTESAPSELTMYLALLPGWSRRFASAVVHEAIRSPSSVTAYR